MLNLEHELHLGRLSRPLGNVAQLRDPHARRSAFHRAGFREVSPQDANRAAEIVRHQRRALLAEARPVPSAVPVPRPQPSDDDLVELMAEALVRAVRFDGLDLDDDLAVETGLIGLGFAPLDAGRADIVRPAVARARGKLRRSALLDHAADGAAFGTLILGWTALYGLLCPPARAATGPVLTDEGLAHLTPWGLFAIGALFVLALFWADRGKPWASDAEPDPVAPPTAPDLADIEVRSRAADRG